MRSFVFYVTRVTQRSFLNYLFLSAEVFVRQP